eukprot:TRINITY_DN9455_c0_g6_i2.p3 TRINITY_DN9455_c0_g6~~TRINITY_DN9455_c0_g6_i2.p3  ORF type:complete len:100 (-),score=0.12 TRINITY_DN9455_c0_g6_i2:937-1236(-)
MKKQNIKGIEIICTRNIIPAIIIKSTIKEKKYKSCNCTCAVLVLLRCRSSVNAQHTKVFSMKLLFFAFHITMNSCICNTLVYANRRIIVESSKKSIVYV